MAVRRRGVSREQIDAPNALFSGDGSCGATPTFTSTTLPKIDLVQSPSGGFAQSRVAAYFDPQN